MSVLCTYSTFLSLEVCSNSSAFLAAKFPEGKRSDYKNQKGTGKVTEGKDSWDP